MSPTKIGVSSMSYFISLSSLEPVVAVEVVEQPAPGVVTVTEVEETEVRQAIEPGNGSRLAERVVSAVRACR